MAQKLKQLKYFTFVLLMMLLLLLCLITPTNQESLTTNAPTHIHNEGSENSSSSNENDSATAARNTNSFAKNVPYFQASLTMRVYECLRDFSVSRCTKLFMLQKMEERKNVAHTDNITRDFLNQFFDSDERLGSLINNKFANMSDEQLNKFLILEFQKFFKHRDIKLHILPGVEMKIVPSRNNNLSFALKKGKTPKKHNKNDISSGRTTKLDSSLDETLSTADMSEAQSDELANTKNGELGGIGGVGVGGIRRKNKKGSSYSSYKTTILQMAVPVMVMPAILMGTVIPFLLPVLKMATIMSIVLNNSAFIAALIYAARTHANAQEEQHISYPPQGHF
ncbi:uncharacterized protein [Eurosta solidaginis]|uniref:uncharacterized protein n=1 Tax=Eurosta solidaginis TaxID=178769 RepID=UPI0035310E46